MYSVFNTLSEYTYFYILKTLLHTLFCLFLKPVESLQCILNKNKAALTFNEVIKKPFYKYPRKFSENCFSLKAISLKSTKYSISFRGPKIWNKFLTKEEKELQSFSIFKKVSPLKTT